MSIDQWDTSDEEIEHCFIEETENKDNDEKPNYDKELSKHQYILSKVQYLLESSLLIEPVDNYEVSLFLMGDE